MNRITHRGVGWQMRYARGFNLVELMVAMTIGLLLMGSIGYIYLGAQRNFAAVEGLARIQENARYAFERMSRDLRMVDFTGGIPWRIGGAIGPGVGNVGCSPLAVGDDPCALNNKDKNHCFYLFGVGSGGKVGDPDYDPTGNTKRCALHGKQAQGQQDTLFILGADSERALFLSAEPTHAAGTNQGAFTLECPSDDSVPLPKKDDILVVSSPFDGQLLSANNAPNGECKNAGDTVSLQYTVLNDVSGDKTEQIQRPCKGHYDVCTLYPLVAANYEINKDGVLTRHDEVSDTRQVLIRGVNSMDIRYGVDADGDGAIDSDGNDYRDATGVNGLGGTAAENWNRVRAVKVTLTLNDPDANSDTADFTRTFTQIIAVRNRLLRSGGGGGGSP